MYNTSRSSLWKSGGHRRVFLRYLQCVPRAWRVCARVGLQCGAAEHAIAPCTSVGYGARPPGPYLSLDLRREACVCTEDVPSGPYTRALKLQRFQACRWPLFS